MHDARPNPYLTPCFLCGGLRCVACEVLDTRLRTASATQAATLHARQIRHRAKYHADRRSMEDTPPWLLDDLAVQATGAPRGITTRHAVAVGTLAGLCLAGLLQPAGVSAALTASIAQETAAATEQLWRRADRIALVAAQQADPVTVAPALAEEAEQLARLAEAAARARDGLALATVRGGAAELEPLCLGLELVGEQVHESIRH
ncbi:MAG: hypothetical protein ACRDJE_29510 [Dehalococcoidia bacterium]